MEVAEGADWAGIELGAGIESAELGSASRWVVGYSRSPEAAACCRRSRSGERTSSRCGLVWRQSGPCETEVRRRERIHEQA